MAEKKKSGFVQIPSYEDLKDNNISHAEYVILSVIARYETMDKGYCYLSIEGIGRATNLGITQTKTHLRSLENKGFIVGIHKHRKSTCYNTTDLFFEAGKPTSNEAGKPTAKRAGKPTTNNIEPNNIDFNNNKYTNKGERVFNHPESVSEVIEEVAKKGCNITEDQASDFINYYSQTANDGLWNLKGSMVTDWRKLISRRWIDNWKEANEKERKKHLRDIIAGKNLSHDPKDFGEADEI